MLPRTSAQGLLEPVAGVKARLPVRQRVPASFRSHSSLARWTAADFARLAKWRSLSSLRIGGPFTS